MQRIKIQKGHKDASDKPVHLYPSSSTDDAEYFPGETGTILATCGGNTVCFIDVLTGMVMKRFKDTDKAEVRQVSFT